MEIFGYSNVAIIVNPAPMEQAIALKCAIEAKVKQSGKDISHIAGSLQIGGMLDPAIIDLILALASDIDINKYIMDCLERCTYNKNKITSRTFDDVNARKDYYKIALECIKVNIWPFYEGLISEWTAKTGTIPDEGQMSL